MRLDNARTREQIDRMKALKAEGRCFFCLESYEGVGAEEPFYWTKCWVVKPNDFPYPGAKHHHLIVSRIHARSIDEVGQEAWSELFSVIRFLTSYTGAPGRSIFARSGDMGYTGATLDHLHLHFLSGGTKPEYPKDTPEEEKLKDNIVVTLSHKVQG